MAAIWSEVLKLGHIGRDDNFFELGGHSLLVTQVVSRVRRRLDLQVPLRTLFEHSTLRAYAQVVAQLAPAAQGGSSDAPGTHRRSCRSPRNASGSSGAWIRTARPTTSRWRCV